MGSLIDKHLAAGVGTHMPASDGQPVKILSGRDAGKTFTGCIYNGEDYVLTTDLGEDRRAHRTIEFYGAPPCIEQMEMVEFVDEMGITRRMNAVRQPGSGYLSKTFELKEIAPGKDS